MVFLIVALIPLGVAMYNAMTRAEQELKNSLNEEYYLITKHLSDNIDDKYFRPWMSKLTTLAESFDNRYAMDVSSVISMMDVVLRQTDELLVLSLKPESSKPYHFINQEKMKSFSDSDLTLIQNILDFRSSKITDGIHTSDAILLSGGKLMLPIEVHFRWKEKESATVIGLFDMTNVLQTINRETTGQKAVYMLDVSGKIVAANNFRHLEVNAIVDYPIIEKIQEQLRGKAKAFQLESFTYNEKKYLGYFSVLTNAPWAVLVVGEYDIAYALVSQMRANTIFWSIGAIGICIVFALIFSRTLTRSISHLADVSNRIGEGDLSMKVDVSSRDEIGILAEAIQKMIGNLREREHMKRFVSANTAEMIKSTGEKLAHDVTRKEISVLFSDIRGFSAFSEKVEPEEVIDMLNVFLAIQSKHISRFAGDIDKFVGDEVMAIFVGANHEVRAIKCAIEIQKEMYTARTKSGKDIHIGIGIHSGVAVMGTVGYGERLEHTVHGSNVNLGSRLCSYAKADQIIVSETVVEKAKEKFNFERLESIPVKGFSKPVTVYAVIEENKVV